MTDPDGGRNLIKVTVNLTPRAVEALDQSCARTESDRLMVLLIGAMLADRTIRDPSTRSASDEGTVVAEAVVIADTAAGAETHLAAVVGAMTDYRMTAVERQVLPERPPGRLIRRRRRRD